MTEKKHQFPARRAIAIAAVAGALAGAVAVYVTGGPAGNQPPANVADAACAAKADRAKTIGAAATGAVAAMLSADPPVSLSTLAFNGPDGKPMAMRDLAGKTVLMNLWATWCVPCREEMPALDALETQMGGEGFEVVAVNVDTGDDAKPRKFLEEIGVNALGYYREPTLGLFNELKKRSLAFGLPVTLLVDAEGCLMAHMNGPADWAGADATRFIETATGG